MDTIETETRIKSLEKALADSLVCVESAYELISPRARPKGVMDLAEMRGILSGDLEVIRHQTAAGIQSFENILSRMMLEAPTIDEVQLLATTWEKIKKAISEGMPESDGERVRNRLFDFVVQKMEYAQKTLARCGVDAGGTYWIGYAQAVREIEEMLRTVVDVVLSSRTEKAAETAALPKDPNAA